ncbi:MAG: ureidoglycolate lyase [Deltaproteobacteria bacterium]|nr:ureidoglycolate lyase [Deltaproteobacteria bacterium]
MAETIAVKLQPLTAEAFRPYGHIVDEKHPAYPDVEEGRPAVLAAHLKHNPNARRVGQLAIHFSYGQTFVPLQGSMVLIVAPPPRNREAGHDAYELDYERLAAFVLEPGDAAHIDKGVWHIVATLGGDCRFLTSTRLDPARKGTSEVAEPEGPLTVEQLIERQKQKTSYIEFVDVQKRDNRIIELEL